MNPPDIQGYKRQIDAALEYAGGSYTFDDVCAAVANGRLQFWPGETSVILTEILSEPNARTLHLFLAGGALTELKAMVPVIEQWGREQGCTRAVFTGRKGWEKTFVARMGYEPKTVQYLKTAL